MKLKNVIISLVLSATMIFTPTVSVFAATGAEFADVSETIGDMQVMEELGSASGATCEWELANGEDESVEEQLTAPILKSNRYYYTVKKTGAYHSFPFTLTAAQAKSYNSLRSALILALTIPMTGELAWTKKFISTLATIFADNVYGTAKAKAGTYTGRVYEVTKYKVDSLTGKQTKVARGVRLSIPMGGVTTTVTKWESK